MQVQPHWHLTWVLQVELRSSCLHNKPLPTEHFLSHITFFYSCINCIFSSKFISQAPMLKWQAPWHTHIISGLGRWRQTDSWKSLASLSCRQPSQTDVFQVVTQTIFFKKPSGEQVTKEPKTDFWSPHTCTHMNVDTYIPHKQINKRSLINKAFPAISISKVFHWLNTFLMHSFRSKVQGSIIGKIKIVRWNTGERKACLSRRGHGKMG